MKNNLYLHQDIWLSYPAFQEAIHRPREEETFFLYCDRYVMTDRQAQLQSPNVWLDCELHESTRNVNKRYSYDVSDVAWRACSIKFFVRALDGYNILHIQVVNRRRANERFDQIPMQLAGEIFPAV